MFERFTVAGRAAWSLLGLAAATAVLLWIGWQFRVVLPPLVLAGAIVFILNPIVTGLARRNIPRAAGTGITYVGFTGIIVLGGFLIAPLVQTQTEELADDWPEIRDDIETWLNDLSQRSKDDGWLIEIPNVDDLRDQLGGTSSAEAQEFDRVVDESVDALDDNDEQRLAAELDVVAGNVRGRLDEEGGIAEQFNTIREIGTRVFEVGLIFILAPIIAFYLLVDIPHIGAVVRRLIPGRAEAQVLHVGHRLNLTIGGYFRGQLMVALIVGAMVSVGLAILGLPFWLLVGMIAGLFNLVPLIGPWVGAVPGIAIALATRDFGTAIWVAAIMAGAQQIDNHFISPLVMQRTTSLHPAVVMLALLAGGTLGGFFGLLLAVPITAALKVLVGHMWAVYVLETPIEEVIAATATGPPEDTSGPLETLQDYVTDELGVDHDAEAGGADSGDPDGDGDGADIGSASEPSGGDRTATAEQ